MFLKYKDTKKNLTFKYIFVMGTYKKVKNK